MKGRYVVRITAQDVGRRVSVRSRLRGEAYGSTDTVGRLESWEAGRLAIERRDGTLVEVAEEDLLAARVIPGEPPRRGSDRSGRAEPEAGP